MLVGFLTRQVTYALTWILKAGLVGISKFILVRVGSDAQKRNIKEIGRQGPMFRFIYNLPSSHDNYIYVKMMDNSPFWHNRAKPYYPARVLLFVFLFI